MPRRHLFAEVPVPRYIGMWYMPIGLTQQASVRRGPRASSTSVRRGPRASSASVRRGPRASATSILTVSLAASEASAFFPNRVCVSPMRYAQLPQYFLADR